MVLDSINKSNRSRELEQEINYKKNGLNAEIIILVYSAAHEPRLTQD